MTTDDSHNGSDSQRRLSDQILANTHQHSRGCGRLDAHGRHHPLAAECPQDSQPPPAARGRAGCPLATRGARVAAGHRCGDAGLVNKNQVLGVELPYPLAEDRALRLDIGPIPLAGAQRLFCAAARAAAACGTGSAG